MVSASGFDCALQAAVGVQGPSLLGPEFRVTLLSGYNPYLPSRPSCLALAVIGSVSLIL